MKDGSPLEAPGSHELPSSPEPSVSGPAPATSQSGSTPQPSSTPQFRHGSGAVGRTLVDRCSRLYDDLTALVGEVFRRHNVAPNGTDLVRLALDAEVELRAGQAAAGRLDADERRRAFAEALLAELHELAGRHNADAAQFPMGRVHCYWCGGCECVHSVPPDSRSVFREYSPTGEPVWADFAALALECQHPLIESLYKETPATITMVRAGSYLTREQLGVYGKHSNAYRVLGQVMIGYVPLRSADGRRERTRLALSIQAVETHHLRLRYHLNVIGVLPDGTPASHYLEEQIDVRLVDALATARAKLSELSLAAPRPGRAGRSPGGSQRGPRSPSLAVRERRAMRVLNRLARNVDRIYRQSSRRTNHAQERHRNRERPASTAVRDTLAASAEAILRDVREGTWVVVGPRSRVHVFNDSGHHVTSIVYPGETIRKRTATGLWKPQSVELAESFRDRVRKTMGRQE